MFSFQTGNTITSHLTSVNTMHWLPEWYESHCRCIITWPHMLTYTPCCMYNYHTQVCCSHNNNYKGLLQVSIRIELEISTLHCKFISILFTPRVCEAVIYTKSMLLAKEHLHYKIHKVAWYQLLLLRFSRAPHSSSSLHIQATTSLNTLTKPYASVCMKYLS